MLILYPSVFWRKSKNKFGGQELINSLMSNRTKAFKLFTLWYKHRLYPLRALLLRLFRITIERRKCWNWTNRLNDYVRLCTRNVTTIHCNHHYSIYHLISNTTTITTTNGNNVARQTHPDIGLMSYSSWSFRRNYYDTFEKYYVSNQFYIFTYVT